MPLTSLTPEQDRILRHALGLDWKPKEYRNHYAAAFRTGSMEVCEYLVLKGLMARGDELGYGTLYHVTELGRMAVKTLKVVES